MQGQGQSQRYHDGDDGPRDPHHNGSVHSNSSLNTGGLPMSPEEEDTMRKIRAFHGEIAKLQTKCAELESETIEMEKKVEDQGWADEAAIGQDMKAERMREEEQEAADKDTEDLLIHLRYNESLLKAEIEKYEKLKANERVLLEREERELTSTGNHKAMMTSRNYAGSNKSRNPSGAAARRMMPAGSLSAKLGSEAKNNGKG